MTRKSSGATTLSEFIHENQDLVSVFGVFIALVAVVGSLKMGVIGAFISLLLLVAAIVVWLELWANAPLKSRSWRLAVFELVLSVITFAVAAYWMDQLRSIWEGFFAISLIGSALLLWITAAKRISELVKLFRSRPAQRRYSLISMTILGLLILLSVVVLIYYATSANPQSIFHLTV